MNRHNKLQVQYQDENDLISNETRDFISIRPHFIIRSGNLIFFLVLLLLALLTWFIPYPDIISGSARLLALNSPKLVSAREDGRLEKLFVENDQHVKQGDILAYLQSTADHNQVFQLKKWISSLEPLIEKHQFDILINTPLPVLNELGELQKDYQQFYISLKETTLLLSDGYYQNKKISLEKDITYLSQLQQSFNKQRILKEQNLELQELDFRAKEKLASEKVLAPMEFNQEKAKKLDREERREQINTEQINLDLSVHAKEKEILELQKNIFTLEQKFYSDLLVLKSSLDGWMEKYVVQAPVEGKVLFYSFLKEKQWINNGQTLFYVQPPQNQYYVELMVAQNGLGKIRNNQVVLVSIVGYPRNEFGELKGKISFISNIPSSTDSFLIKVDLPRGLTTSHNKGIFFKNNLMGQAEVITNNRRLGQRLWGNLTDILTR